MEGRKSGSKLMTDTGPTGKRPFHFVYLNLSLQLFDACLRAKTEFVGQEAVSPGRTAKKVVRIVEKEGERVIAADLCVTQNLFFSFALPGTFFLSCRCAR